MSTTIEAVRCGDCHEAFALETNLLDGKPVWIPPKKKRGGCQHPNAHGELMVNGQWIKPGDPIPKPEED